jgi:hypothetical protein
VFTLDLARAQIRELERVAELARRNQQPAARRNRRRLRAG